MFWSIHTHVNALDKCRTTMGRMEYASAGSDFNNDVFCPFDDPDDVFIDPWEIWCAGCNAR